MPSANASHCVRSDWQDAYTEAASVQGTAARMQPLEGSRRRSKTGCSNTFVYAPDAKSHTPLVFKYECMGLTRGCSIDFLSVYPGEAEFLYSPLTYICYKGSSVEDGVTVISVEPQRA